jgi:hypothetical protein
MPGEWVAGGLSHDGAAACARSILDAFPEGFFGADKARAYHAIYLRVRAGMEAVLRAQARAGQTAAPSPN